MGIWDWELRAQREPRFHENRFSVIEVPCVFNIFLYLEF